MYTVQLCTNVYKYKVLVPTMIPINDRWLCAKPLYRLFRHSWTNSDLNLYQTDPFEENIPTLSLSGRFIDRICLNLLSLEFDQTKPHQPPLNSEAFE